MAYHAPITGAPLRAPAILTAHARETIESEIHAHLALVDELIARLDAVDAPTEDLEPEFDYSEDDVGECGSWAEYDGVTWYGTLHSYPDDDREETVADRLTRKPHRERIRWERCYPVWKHGVMHYGLVVRPLAPAFGVPA